MELILLWSITLEYKLRLFSGVVKFDPAPGSKKYSVLHTSQDLYAQEPPTFTHVALCEVSVQPQGSTLPQMSVHRSTWPSCSGRKLCMPLDAGTRQSVVSLIWPGSPLFLWHKTTIAVLFRLSQDATVVGKMLHCEDLFYIPRFCKSQSTFYFLNMVGQPCL